MGDGDVCNDLFRAFRINKRAQIFDSRGYVRSAAKPRLAKLQPNLVVARSPYVYSGPLIVAQSCTLSVSPRIVASRANTVHVLEVGTRSTASKATLPTHSMRTRWNVGGTRPYPVGFGCGFAALRCIADLKSAGPRNIPALCRMQFCDTCLRQGFGRQAADYKTCATLKQIPQSLASCFKETVERSL